jgi:lysophospholipase L1-like esterase
MRFTAASAPVVFHGNSLVAGPFVTTPMPAQVRLLAPIRSQVACDNRGQPGYTWEQLRTQGATINALYQAGKTNVLVILEGTNALLSGGQSAAACYASARAYITERLAAHPWRIMLLTTPPFRTASMDDAASIEINGRVTAYNNLLRANWATDGCAALVDFQQAGSPFAISSFTVAAFNAIQYNGTTVWTSSEAQWVHPNDNGYACLARMVALTLRRLPRGS